MKFNITKTALAFATASLLASAAHAAAPSTVNLQFTGALETNTCTPSWSGSDVTTDFGKVGLIDGNVGTPLGEVKPVTLKLTGCNVAGLTVTYNGTEDESSGLFKNAGTATDVALKLTAPGGGAIVPGGQRNITPTSNTADFSVNSQLVLNKTVTDKSQVAGTFTSVVTADIIYK